MMMNRRHRLGLADTRDVMRCNIINTIKPMQPSRYRCKIQHQIFTLRHRRRLSIRCQSFSFIKIVIDFVSLTHHPMVFVTFTQCPTETHTQTDSIIYCNLVF